VHEEVMGCIDAHRKSAGRRREKEMQQTVAVRFLAGTLTLALGVCAFFAAPAAAQPEPSLDAVIAPGNPPLTERFVEQYANLEAWVLEVSLTREFLDYQRSDLKDAWSGPQAANRLRALVDNVSQLTPENRTFLRVTMQKNRLEDLRKQRDPASKFYLEAFAAAHPAIAPGNPPLTESMVSHYVEFVAWLLEIPVTPAFAADQRARLLNDWKNPDTAAGSARVLQWQLTYAEFKGGSLQRDYERTIEQPAWIAQMRAHRENPDSAVMLAAFDAAHPPLAAGQPALTRQMSDAWTELYCLIRDQGLGEHLVADQANKDAFAAQLARQWPTLTAEQRKALSVMPTRWAAVRWVWSAGQPADRAKMVAAWLPAVNPPAPPDAQLAAAIKARARADEFLKKPPSTVTSREMLAAAADQDLLAAQYRRQGAADLAKDAENIARVLHTGSPQAYVAAAPQWAANRDALAIARAQERARIAASTAQLISTRTLTGNAAFASVMSNIPNSPYRQFVSPFPH
jgi:hypothetical protein